MKGFPIISKEYFYNNYPKELYKYHNEAYRHSDTSILLFRDDIIANKTLIFQLVDHLQNEVPNHRKNLYYLPKEDHDRLRIEILDNENKTKKISAALLTKFTDPYDNINIGNLDLSKKTVDVNLVNEICLQINCPILTKTINAIVDSKDKEREIINLTLAKELIEKKISYLKNGKKW